MIDCTHIGELLLGAIALLALLIIAGSLGALTLSYWRSRKTGRSTVIKGARPAETHHAE